MASRAFCLHHTRIYVVEDIQSMAYTNTDYFTRGVTWTFFTFDLFSKNIEIKKQQTNTVVTLQLYLHSLIWMERFAIVLLFIGLLLM